MVCLGALGSGCFSERTEVSNGDEIELLRSRGLRANHVLHIGAHEGQEARLYDDYGIKEVTWVEADPLIIPRLKDNVRKYGHRVIEAACSDKSGQTITFHRADNDGGSSSILQPLEHKNLYPYVHFNQEVQVLTSTLSDIKKSHNLPPADYLVVDVQGAELLVLKGLDQQMISEMKYAFLEVSRVEVYKGQALFGEINDWMESNNFACVAGCNNNEAHSNAFFVRKDLADSLAHHS